MNRVTHDRSNKKMMLILIFILGVGAAGIAPAFAAPARAPAASLTLEAVNNANLTRPAGPKTKGPAVLRAQVLLDRARFSPGEIDAAFGSNMQKAIAAFQKANGLQPSGTVDLVIWCAEWRARFCCTNSRCRRRGPVRHSAARWKTGCPLMAKPWSRRWRKISTQPCCCGNSIPARIWGAGKQSWWNIEGCALARRENHREGPIPRLRRSTRRARPLPTFPRRPAASMTRAYGSWKVTGRENPVFHYNPKLFWDAPQHIKARSPPAPTIPWACLDRSSKEHTAYTARPSRPDRQDAVAWLYPDDQLDAAELAKIALGTPAILQEEKSAL
jgi:peptidoglycan hydrolase-like protein with peptidoglycan-binding domain